MSLFLIALLTFAAWLYLSFFRSGFWRAGERLTDAPPLTDWPDIAVVIPARDEAETIGAVIEAHMACDYAGPVTVFLVDDQSSDGTAAIAENAAASADTGRKLNIISGETLPDGWSGKMWAVHQGLMASQALNARYTLLCDADIVLAPDTLRRLVAKAESERLSLTSLMARLDCRGRWGGLLIPAFIYFFQKLYPFPRANDVNDGMAAAAGGCMLVSSDALTAIGGVSAIRGALIDDCALARQIKNISPSTRIWIGLATQEAYSLRDNRSLRSVWAMVARTAYAQLGFSPLMLIGSVLGMLLVYLAPPFIFLTLPWHGDIAAWLLAAAAWSLMAHTYWPTLKVYERERWESALLPAAAALYTAMTVSSALRFWQGAGARWKGRDYAS